MFILALEMFLLSSIINTKQTKQHKTVNIVLSTQQKTEENKSDNINSCNINFRPSILRNIQSFIKPISK